MREKTLRFFLWRRGKTLCCPFLCTQHEVRTTTNSMRCLKTTVTVSKWQVRIGRGSKRLFELCDLPRLPLFLFRCMHTYFFVFFLAPYFFVLGGALLFCFANTCVLFLFVIGWVTIFYTTWNVPCTHCHETADIPPTHWPIEVALSKRKVTVAFCSLIVIFSQCSSHTCRLYDYIVHLGNHALCCVLCLRSASWGTEEICVFVECLVWKWVRLHHTKLLVNGIVIWKKDSW